MAAASETTVSSTTYDLIGAWVGQQRLAPTPLTDKLRSALLGLEYALKVESVSVVEPELGEFNWVGHLQEYRAARPFQGSREVIFTDSPFDPTGRALRWKCQVFLAEAKETFPYGDASQHTFAKKRDAKRYAAKCAVDWLRANGFMPQSGGVKFPKSASIFSQQKQQQQQQAQPKPPSSPFHTTKPSSPPAVIPASPFDASQPSAAHQANELCTVLGLPSPVYRVESTDEKGSFFSGSADFGAYNAILPFDVSKSRVENIMGKKAAKEMIAENLLKLLQEEKQKRAAADEAFLAQHRSGDAK
ncbi:hypothetical protein FHL15_008385 [Xylaria flabelliformis]|uniref:DRBM domain-containing protein n=1 Tax=Xylaria flabelliformis TaxID=2512241 RepID=A0A553HS84_9PEZI|nr:hypothetical protein FHL15_008385 [Xylaria flabelliformis]